MGFRDTLARALGLKTSIIPLDADQFPDRPLEREFDDSDLLSTFRDDPWPYVLLNKVAEQAAQPRWLVGALDRDRQFTATPDHPVQDLLDAPHDGEDGWGFRYLLILYLEAVGHAPIEIVRPQRGRGILRGDRAGWELWLVRPGPWRIVANPDGTIKGYLYLQEGRPDIRWTPTQMSYLRWPNPNDRWYGQGRLAAVRQEIMAEEYASQRDKRFEKNLGVPPGILTSEMPLGEPQATELQKRWQQAVGGFRNAGKIAVLGSKTTYQAIAQTARDAQWLEQRRHRIEAMAAAAGVPMPLVRMEDATFSNAAAARAEFWEGTLQPRLNAITEMVTRRVLPLLTADEIVVRPDYGSIEALGENDLEAAQTATAWANTGSVTVDEVRARLTLPPHPNKEIGLRLILPSTLALSDPALLVQSQELGVQGQAMALEAPQPPEEPPPPAKALPYKSAPIPTRVEALGPILREYRDELGRFFGAQREALRTSRLQKAIPEHDPRDLVERARDILGAKRFRDRLSRISRPPIEAAVNLGAGAAASGLRIDPTFVVATSHRALAAVGERMTNLVTAVEQTTLEGVRTIVGDYLASDEMTYNQLQDGLTELFDGWADWRSERIARTEIAYAYAAGEVGQLKEAGVSEVDIVDGDGDEPCAEANGARWTIDQYESDPLAHPNCTRIAIPVTELDEAFKSRRNGQSTFRLTYNEAGKVVEIVEA